MWLADHATEIDPYYTRASRYGFCTRKNIYPTQKRARKYAAIARAREQAATGKVSTIHHYKCPAYDHWHIGHKRDETETQ